jgi:hypothetical protein
MPLHVISFSEASMVAQTDEWVIGRETLRWDHTFFRQKERKETTWFLEVTDMEK